MAWTNYQFFLAGLMVVTGSINTLSTKWADETKSPGRDHVVRNFDHPFTQASCMFFGEMMCLVAFKVMYFIYSRRNDGSEDIKEFTKGNRHFNPFILALPAVCDMTATSIMYIGLNLTYPSSFQMFRGAVIVFTGLLSTAFLERILKRREWYGIVMVIIGLSIVGTADFLSKDDAAEHDRNSIITGDLLIIIAQIVAACQMVIEEKFVSGLDIPPLQAVGLEGVFGFVILSSLQVLFYFIPAFKPFSNNSRNVLEDPIEAFVQIVNQPILFVAIGGTILSIAFFNFAGLSVTKQMSATTRMVLDSVRTIVIWAFSLTFLHEHFHWLQLLGFSSLLFGMALYNNITCRPLIIKLLAGRSRYRTLGEDEIVNAEANQPQQRI